MDIKEAFQVVLNAREEVIRQLPEEDRLLIAIIRKKADLVDQLDP